MSEHSTPKRNYELRQRISDTGQCSLKNQITAITVSPLVSAHSSFCNRQSSFNLSTRGIRDSINDSRSPVHIRTPADRLKLIHILQELHFDNVINALPDEYTYEDLVSCSLENLYCLLSRYFCESEIRSLYSQLHLKNGNDLSDCTLNDTISKGNLENLKVSEYIFLFSKNGVFFVYIYIYRGFVFTN